jgi:transposase
MIDVRYLERWRRDGASQLCGRWKWMKSIWARARSFSPWSVICRAENRSVRLGAEEGNLRSVQEELSPRQRQGIEAACVDMREPFRLSLEQWAPLCRLIYDKFHIMQHANEAVKEVRRAEFFRQGREMRELVKGKHWLLLTRWVNLSTGKKRMLQELFALNRRLTKAYLLKESLDRLWSDRYPGAMMRYCSSG